MEEIFFFFGDDFRNLILFVELIFENEFISSFIVQTILNSKKHNKYHNFAIYNNKSAFNVFIIYY